MSIKNILKTLHINKQNFGASNSHKWWSSNKSDAPITSYNPSTGKAIATVYPCDQEDYERVITQSKEVFAHWGTLPAPKRGDIVRQIGEKLREHKSVLGSLVALEAGKSKQEGDGEVQEMIDMADFAVGQSRMLYGNTMHSERPSHRMYEQWHPLGPIGIITAFNFPVAVWAWNAFIAAICGNTVVWKPSSQTPLCAIAIQHICNEVMEKNNLEGLFSLLITPNSEFASQLVNSSALPLISFTGSSDTGKKVSGIISQQVGRRSLLECSGNNAIIVDETANLDLAIRSIVFSAVGTAGQRCTSARRLFVHSSVAKQVTDKLIAAYKSITIGDPLNEKNLMGPLINQAAVDQYLFAVQKAQQAGGSLLCGGNQLDQPGFFVEPTLIKAQNEWDIVQHETFAPILYIIPFQELDQAIALQNHSLHGLSSSLFTTNLQHAERFLAANGSDCGIANINIGTSGAEIGGAFGGEKGTGGGREAGSDAWKAYMRRQTNTINWGNEVPLAQGITFVL